MGLVPSSLPRKFPLNKKARRTDALAVAAHNPDPARLPYLAQGGESRHVCWFEDQDLDVNGDYVSSER